MHRTIIKSNYRPNPVVILDADLFDVFDLDRSDWEVVDLHVNRATRLPLLLN